MKKLSVCLVLVLVMCLTMVFPVGAATVTDASLAEIYDPIIDKILEYRPAGYNYQVVYTTTNMLTVAFFDVPNVPSTSVIYYNMGYNFNTGLFNVETPLRVERSICMKVTAGTLPALEYSSGNSPIQYLIVDRSTAKFYNHDTFENGLGKTLNWQLKLGAHYAPIVLPDTTELETLLVQADGIEDIGYTVPSWTRFDNARFDGHALLALPVYTEVEVSGASTELRMSMNGLTLMSIITPLPPSSGGYDLGTGDIGGFLAPGYGIFTNYVVSMYPVMIGFFSIIFGIKLIPHVLNKIISVFKR